MGGGDLAGAATLLDASSQGMQLGQGMYGGRGSSDQEYDVYDAEDDVYDTEGDVEEEGESEESDEDEHEEYGASLDAEKLRELMEASHQEGLSLEDTLAQAVAMGVRLPDDVLRQAGVSAPSEEALARAREDYSRVFMQWAAEEGIKLTEGQQTMEGRSGSESGTGDESSMPRTETNRENRAVAQQQLQQQFGSIGGGTASKNGGGSSSSSGGSTAPLLRFSCSLRQRCGVRLRQSQRRQRRLHIIMKRGLQRKGRGRGPAYGHAHPPPSYPFINPTVPTRGCNPSAGAQQVPATAEVAAAAMEGEDEGGLVPLGQPTAAAKYSLRRFKTAMLNNLDAHFMAKLKRLCKLMASRNANGQQVKDWQLLEALQENDVPDSWPDALEVFPAEVRSTLRLESNEVLTPYTKTQLYSNRLSFQWWLQRHFAEFNAQLLMMTPVWSVAWSHLVLDPTTLYHVARWCLQEPQQPPPTAPTKRQYSKKDELKAAHELYAKVKAEWDKYRARLKTFQEQNPSYLVLMKKGALKDPVRALNKQHPMPLALGQRPKETWKEKREAYNKAKDDVEKARAEVCNTDNFRKAQEEYLQHGMKVQVMGSCLFRTLKDRSPAKGWRPSGTIRTDNVSPCTDYVHHVQKPIFELAGKASETPRKTKKQWRAERDAALKKLLTGKKHTWKFTRGQYYMDSGIHNENAWQAGRLHVLADEFRWLTSQGGVLKAITSAQVMAYVRAYSVFKDRCAVDSFFACLRKDAQKLSEKVEVVYGLAVKSMACTRRGEVAAPIGETFRSCQRTFGPANVALTGECNTTKVSFETGARKELVYKTYSHRGKELLAHTPAQNAPPVPANMVALVQGNLGSMWDKAKRR
ncbi:hypothetical protein VOLCADRAFT_108686 [Volvox carteri f. nagariensis]|uniref:Uncharacterized protein n=1 Tax=Volvox carteri f. nagariensis TaxID=3068 RepID=D8ULU4_VOLCA|nr:uncharacterized protein VOLCADRAFT_108686 [Volvox carteri f. nagariensis]EFJ39305.1 hypothetical protein VOLCADRAFT_108686 [Volvox carteri f. nagariensis]|eukprot:XP_002959630.1 hypothetical protein VOLCADRAFT_108686 [Volvox carteri f. nagariensis]